MSSKEQTEEDVLMVRLLVWEFLLAGLVIAGLGISVGGVKSILAIIWLSAGLLAVLADQVFWKTYRMATTKYTWTAGIFLAGVLVLILRAVSHLKKATLNFCL